LSYQDSAKCCCIFCSNLCGSIPSTFNYLINLALILT
jgi:hypothetical protein